MKINVSLSLKLTLVVVIVSVIIIGTSSYMIIYQDREIFLNKIHGERAAAIAQIIDTSLKSYSGFDNQEKIQEFIENISILHPDIIKLNINLLNESGGLTIFASSNNSFIGKPSDLYIIRGKSYSNLCYEEGHDFYISGGSGDSRYIIALTPLKASGETYGTYEIVLSMDKAYRDLDFQLKNTFLYSIFLLFIIIGLFLYLLRRIIVKPIIAFRDTSRIIGEGNLNAKIDIKSRDELGELACAFNQMTEDLKSSRDKIEEYNKVLKNLLKQKDEFIGQLGHDLKNPLTPLTALLPMILKEEKDSKLKKDLRLIIHNVDYMKDLIFKTLELAKLRSFNIKFDMQNLNLSKEVSNVLKKQKVFLDQNHIKVKNKIEKNINVTADKLRLEELITNLISNAVKYTPTTGGIITLDAKQDQKVVKVSIKDSGIGMTEDQLNRVFDEFYMANESSRKIGSSGLGLAICKRIVEKHGGRIWAESRGLGKGSTIYFTLNRGIKKS